MNPSPITPPALSALPSTPDAILLELLTALDATTDEQQILQLTLDAVVTLVPCCQAFAYEWEETDGTTQLRASACTDSSFLNDYFSRFRSIDPFATEALRSGRGIASREVMSPETLRRHPFHTRFLAHHGDLVFGLSLFAHTGPQRLVSLRLFRGAGRAPFSPSEHDALGLFHTHVAHRLRERHRVRQLEHELAAHRAANNAWNRPIFLLDHDGAVIARNAAADQILRDGRRLALDSARRLAPGRKYDHASRLNTALRSISASARSGGNRHRSRCIGLPSDGSRMPRHYGLLVGLAPAASPATTLLILIDSAQPTARYSSDELRDLLGFTATEARIANALVSGMSTEEICQAFLVRPDTVRTHVKRLLAKTGTRSHAELQKLLIRLTPNLVALTPSGTG